MSVDAYNAARRGLLLGVTNSTNLAPNPAAGINEEPIDLKVDLVDIREKEQWGDTPLITLTPSRHQAKSSSAAKYEDYVLVLRRKFNILGEKTTTNLEIRSPHIQKAFRAVLGDYPSISFDSTLVEIPKPYAPLFHYRRELREYASDASRSIQEKEHLDVLMKFMEKNLSQTEREFGYSEPYQMVSYPLLWTLFRPEEVIIAQGDHFDECYVVDSVEYVDKVHPGTDVDMTPYLKIHARRWDYNGTRFGMADEKLKIREFPTAVKIDTLKVYPIRFHKKESTDVLQKRLIERGRKWRTILDKSHRYYDALAWSEPPNQPSRPNHVDLLVPSHVSGRIMLDYGTHKQAAPQLASNLSTSGAATEKDYRFQSVVKSDSTEDTSMARKASDKEDRFMSHLNTSSYEISDEQALLCPARVRGYSFLEKIWAFFLVDEVKEIDWQTNAFDSLELDPRMKSAILAMVSTHRHSDNFDDIIPGKGKGLVFLLYGRPGLGKTLTAEAVAEHTKTPLYSITSGELGTEVAQTDFQLRTIFARAKVWDAIVLLDEADVFLAQRSATDLKRNAYVSVFLRLIEYHKGIMFLTTNRLQDFDDAFQSRIHLTIRYEALDSIRRTSIWGNFLKKVKSGNWDEHALARLGADYDLNGREIKNLLRTALAISRYEKVELSEALIRRVLDLSKEHLLEEEH